MTNAHLYGIRNCDTMKKALQWLDTRNIPCTFHDYKKTGADTDILKQAIKQHGWETVINRKGTSWRALPDSLKDGMNEKTAIAAAMENPSLIRRPLLVYKDAIYLGFDDAQYTALFKNHSE